ncbi:MAG: MotA/TolQ/ExbB proton channel family protein [Lentisphaerae bacterium]|jgi:biopolymer transport protein ExbB|nr:MotA/TolQ/ExbB proton channel family protein [Lentisphaerota bacterium]
MMGYLLDGGWLMLPLLICSIALLAIVIDRARAFRAASIDHEGLRKQVNAAVAAGQLDQAITLCEQSTGPVAATLLAGLLRLKRLRAGGQKSAAEIEITVSKAMEDFAPKAMHGLERRLNAIVLIASISPLLGMTGTVTGMIRSFGVMAASAGLDPGAVAGGIAEALITTAAGLLIAAPGVVIYNFFVRKIEEYTMSIEGGIAELMEAIAES